MSRLRYFFLQINILNGLLVAAVAAVGYFFVIPLLNPAAFSPLPPVKETAALHEEEALRPPNPPPTDYTVISGRNLFHPERIIPPEKQPEKVMPKPEIFLYGTLITDNVSFAFIEDKKAPYSTAGRGKRQVTLKKGDRLHGYVLTEVEANRIVLAKGDEKVVVMLDDREKKRDNETAQPPGAARTGPGGPNPNPFQPPASSYPPAMPSSAQAAQTPGPGIGIAGSPRPSVQPSVAPSSQAAPTPAQAATTPGPGTGDSGYGLSTRRTRVQEVQRIKAERQTSPTPPGN